MELGTPAIELRHDRWKLNESVAGDRPPLSGSDPYVRVGPKGGWS
jgi:hypothetical protein